MTVIYNRDQKFYKLFNRVCATLEDLDLPELDILNTSAGISIPIIRLIFQTSRIVT